MHSLALPKKAGYDCAQMIKELYCFPVLKVSEERFAEVCDETIDLYLIQGGFKVMILCVNTAFPILRNAFQESLLVVRSFLVDCF